MMVYHGGCHCGQVRFEFEAPEGLECLACNCSICSMTGFLHYIIPREQFKLLTSIDKLSCYTFGTRVAKHYFCIKCGVKSFYIPRSNPNGVDVNVRCLTEMPQSIDIKPFNGKRWEEHAHELAHLTPPMPPSTVAEKRTP